LRPISKFEVIKNYAPALACAAAIENFYVQKSSRCIFTKIIYTMSLLNQNKKDKNNNKKKNAKAASNSKYIQKPQSNSGFVSKQQNTGSQRGS
jgi:hypothetical protein